MLLLNLKQVATLHAISLFDIQLGSMLVTTLTGKQPEVTHRGEAYIWRLTLLVFTWLKLTLKPFAF